MKIYCDYCGTQIDTDKNNNCPNCGASFADNEGLKKALAREEKERRAAKANIKVDEIFREFDKRKNEKKLGQAAMVIGIISIGVIIIMLVKLVAAFV